MGEVFEGEVLNKYGNEFYCPVSLLRAHEMTMMEELKHQGEIGVSGNGEEVIEKWYLRPLLLIRGEEEQTRAAAVIQPWE